MFSLIHGWTDVQRSPGGNLRLVLGFLLGGLLGALGFKQWGYITTLPLAALLWLLCLRPLMTDLRRLAA